MLAAGVWKMKMLRAIVTLWRLSTSSEFVQKNCIFHQLLFFSTCFWQINMRMAKNEFCNDKGIKTFSQDTSYGVQFVFRSLLFYQSISAILHRSGNRPFLSSPGPLFPYTRLSVQPLIWKWFFYSHANKTHFYKKGCALRLILKARVFGTRKWPIDLNPNCLYVRSVLLPCL